MAEDDPVISASIFGQSVAAKGTSAIIILVLLVAFGSVTFLLWERTQQSEEHLDAISAQHSKARDEQTALFNRDHLAIVEAVKGVQSVNEKIGELIEEQNYIVLSNDSDRKAMKEKLRRPPSLSRKLDR